jgi:hypothetical protein
MGVVIDGGRFWIVTELLDCDLRVFLQRRSFTLHEKLNMVEVSHLKVDIVPDVLFFESISHVV